MVKNNFIKLYKKIAASNKGSALLIALIVMGILLTLSLAVSDMLITTFRDNRLASEKAQAWYNAESGIEQALFAVYENPPGFEEPQRNFRRNNTNYNYSIKAAARTYPVINSAYPDNDERQYATLHLNESVAIPFFSGTNTEDGVKKFKVNYYLSSELEDNTNATDLDILRWKIFGINNGNDRREMDVISEFTPMNETQRTASNPTCVGTFNGCWNYAKTYIKNIDGTFNIQDEFIEDFLRDHTQNFLVLTNVVNTDLIGATSNPSQENRKRLANIRYRVIEEDEDGVARLTLPTIRISSNGFAGQNDRTTQSIDLEIKRETFLPVFGYALYRTAD